MTEGVRSEPPAPPDALTAALERAAIAESLATHLTAELTRITRFWRSALIAVVVVALLAILMLGVVAFNAVDDENSNSETAPTSPDRRSATMTPRSLDLREFLVDVTRDDGVRLIAGLRSDATVGHSNDDLVLIGLVANEGRERVQLLVPLPSSWDEGRGCSAEVADDMVPGGPAIIAKCLTGGSNGVGYVTVFGVDPETNRPEMLLLVSCGVTAYTIEGASLTLHSTGPKPGGAFPGEPQPDIFLRWDGGRLEPHEWDLYETVCSETRLGSFVWP